MELRIRRRSRRLHFVLTIVALLQSLLTPPAGNGQPARIPRLCLLAYSELERTYASFLDSLRDLGYIEGTSLIIHRLSADGRFEQFPGRAAECVRSKPDVIVLLTTPGALAVKKATATIPVVSMGSDPVATGIVASLARPGGNITGVALMGPGLSAKRIELLKDDVR